MKKQILLSAAALLTFSLLTGCSEKADISSSVVSTEEPTVEPTTQKIISIDPFEDLDLEYHHRKGGVIEECDHPFNRERRLVADDETKNVLVMSEPTAYSIRKRENLGLSMEVYRDPLPDDIKEGDTITLHLLINNKYVPEDNMKEYVRETFGVELTRITKEITVHFNEDPKTEIDPFEGVELKFIKDGNQYTIEENLEECKGSDKLKYMNIDINYKLSLAEGYSIYHLIYGDKIKHTVTYTEDGKEYSGEEINKLFDERWQNVHLTETEKVFEVENKYAYGRYSANINVSLTRPDNWYQVASNRNRFTKYDLSMIDGSTATVPITAELIRQFNGIEDKQLPYYIDHNTTGDAYENLILGKKYKNLIFVTEPSDDELALAAENNVELQVDKIALDGFVFITHKDNPVDSLTLDQIRDIYSGAITNWSEVGGYDEEIIPYVRSKNSGSQTAMENMVMQGIPMITHPDTRVQIAMEMGGLIDSIATYQNSSKSIGYSFNYYLRNLYKNEDIKVLNIDGISPDNENLINGTYPLSSGYYAVTVKGRDQKAEEIKEYLLSDEGQEMIELAGYCPIR